MQRLTQPLNSNVTNLPPFLHGKLRKAQELVQRINPVLHQLHQRTTTAVEHSKQHLAMRDRAMEERNLVRHLPLKWNENSISIFSYSVPCLLNLKIEPQNHQENSLKLYDSFVRRTDRNLWGTDPMMFYLIVKSDHFILNSSCMLR